MAVVLLKLEEEDFVAVDGAAKVQGETSGDLSEQLSAGKKVDYVTRRLFTVAFEKLREFMPEGYEIKEATFDVSLEGSPFGVGVSGSVSVKVAPNE